MMMTMMSRGAEHKCVTYWKTSYKSSLSRKMIGDFCYMYLVIFNSYFHQLNGKFMP